MPWEFLSQLGGSASSAANTLGNMFGGQQQAAASPQPTDGQQYQQANIPGTSQDQNTATDPFGTKFRDTSGGQAAHQMAGAYSPPTQQYQPPVTAGQIPQIAPFVEAMQAPPLPPQRPMSIASVFARRSGLLG